MLNKLKIIGFSFLSCLSIGVDAQAEDANLPRVAMVNSSEIVYHDKVGEVENLSELFTEGKFYGRLRSNTFHFYWDTQDESHDIQLISGLGGSLVYQSAIWNQFDFRVAAYGSYAFFDDKNDPFSSLKAGHDVLDRYNFSKNGTRHIAVIGQAYLRYGSEKTLQAVVGRQLLETFYVKSNDTKMVPNAVDAFTLNSSYLPKTSISMSYIAKQKLRDKSGSHSVLVYGGDYAGADATSVPDKYSQNDDSAMHRGLTYANLQAAGKPTDAPLIIGDLHNQSVENLKIDTAFYVVPELLSQVMLEGNYKIPLNEKLSITPGFRYVQQFDNGAGAVGGASLYKIGLDDYKDPNSLNSKMFGARLVGRYENYKLNLAYTQIMDEADFVTPWRGFVTKSYTRSMARYNWRANTKSARIELVRNANKTGVYKDLYTQTSIMVTDGDEGKGVKNSIYYYAGFMKNIPSIPELQVRVRFGYQQFLNASDTKFNNLDSRLELNYFF